MASGVPPSTQPFAETTLMVGISDVFGSGRTGRGPVPSDTAKRADAPQAANCAVAKTISAERSRRIAGFIGHPLSAVPGDSVLTWGIARLLPAGDAGLTAHARAFLARAGSCQSLEP